MTEDERMMWELFCQTGEPRYYSLYAKEKQKREDGESPVR